MHSLPHCEHQSLEWSILPSMNLHRHSIITQSPLFTLGFILGVVDSMGLGKCVITSIHYYNSIQYFLLPLKSSAICPVTFPTTYRPQPWIPLFLFFSFFIHNSAFPECLIVGIILYVAFSDWLFYLVICTYGSSMSLYDLIGHFILVLSSNPLFGYLYISFFIQSPTEGHHSCFQILVIINKAAINIHVQVFM